MDLKLLATTFGAVFLAELGDKTQLATMALASGKSSKLSVFFGAALALTASSFLAVVFGEAITRFVPASYLRRGAGVLFVALGALYLIRPE